MSKKIFPKNRLLIFGLFLLTLLIMVSLLASYVAPFDPNYVEVENRLNRPGGKNILGTDGYGRDIFSRIVFGARFSLSLAVLVVLINLCIGVFIGTASGFFGGAVDELTMRLVDILLAFPNIIFALLVIGILGPSIPNLVFALVALGWTNYARITRGLVLSLKEQDFIISIKAIGGGDFYIITRHVIPSIIPFLVVLATLNMGHMIMSIAALSFLGLGVQIPTPEWGSMLSEGKQFIFTHPHVIISPGLAIIIAVFAFNLLGDGLRDVLDPRTKEIIKT
ncbi:MAG: ABC transporter permease [Dethiobacter sp.]|nr:MAG: ABC transporter permease [Dethiobacter sp.]